MGRTPCCDKANVKKGPWSPEEDAKLKDFIEKYGTGGNWISLPQKAGLKRCGKSCRLRWLNYLRPNIKHGDFSEEEDRIICRLFNQIRSKWSVIAAHLPGRTDNDIKNYWNTKLKKKYLATINNNNHFNSLSSQIFTPTPTPNPLLDDPSLQFYRDFYANSSINMMNYLSLPNTQQPQPNIWNNNNNNSNNILPQTHMIQTTENGQWNFAMHRQYQASSESSDGNLSQITQDHNVVTVAATGNANVQNYAASSSSNVVGNISNGGFEENYQSVLMMLQQHQQKGGDNIGGNVNGYGNMASVVSNNPQLMQCNYDDDVHEEVSYCYY